MKVITFSEKETASFYSACCCLGQYVRFKVVQMQLGISLIYIMGKWEVLNCLHTYFRLMK